MDTPVQSAKENRALALDALRGMAILGMILSSRIPFGTLPGWMYHAQNPPPSHQFNPLLPGISWVDLVFPVFLFAMGASFPFAYSKKLDSGMSRRAVIVSILKRGFLLAVFAIIIQHLRPTVINPSPSFFTNITALAGFIFMFLFFMRTPQKISQRSGYLLKAAGAAGLLILLFFIQYPDGSGFSLYRSDIIILVLANVAVSGSIIWLFTRENLLMRCGVLGILIAIRLSAAVDDNWVNFIWDEIQVPWLFKLYYHQYLFIVIPGTIAGDIILKWLSRRENLKTNISSGQASFIGVLFIAYTSLVLTGLYSRYITATVLLTILFSILMFYYLRNKEELYGKLFSWFIYLMSVGLLFEAFEGGIQKGRPTLSFYFVTSALSIILLLSFTVFIYSTKLKFRLFVNNGQNPMLAYAGGTNLLYPFVSLLFIDNLLSYIAVTPWLGALKGLIITLILAVIVDYFTRRKIFWRT